MEMLVASCIFEFSVGMGAFVIGLSKIALLQPLLYKFPLM